MNKENRGELRLKAIPVMVSNDSKHIALSDTIVEIDQEKRGGLITFGVSDSLTKKIILGDSVALCFIFDVKEWDEAAEQVEKTEIEKDELLNALNEVYRLRHLIVFPDDTKIEHHGEAQALQSMIGGIQMILEKHNK